MSNKKIDYEREVEKIQEANNVVLKDFEQWLLSQQLSNKVIKRHLDNASLYINDFLCHYEPQQCIEGTHQVDSFFSDWFLRKYSPSKTGVQEISASIKKFYQYLLTNNKITQESYDELAYDIKESKAEWLESVESYWNEPDFEFLD